jgi:ABC-type transporter Mla maintaining outer membrane lipid asymmetry ATPase subunit MlaF
MEPIPPNPPFPGFFVSDRTRSSPEDAELFGKLEIENKQDVLLRVLQLVEPKLQRLAMVVVGGVPMLHGDIGEERLLPLPLMGAGMTRSLSVVLRISNASNGVVFVDEIENGLHHSLMREIWTAIGELARNLNAQVFATTHSLECIVAAHAAFAASKKDDFYLHRLERANGKIRAVTYDQDALEAAIETGLEMR